MEQAPVPMQDFSQQQQQQQQPFPGQQTYPSGMPALQVGMPGTPGGMNMGMPEGMNMGTPGGMNMGAPGTILPNGQFVPAGMVPPNVGTPGAILPNGQVVFNPPVYAPNAMGGGGVDPGVAPVITREQQQSMGMRVPPGMTRESMQPGYDPQVKRQRRVFDPRYSFKDSFGQRRNKMCGGCCRIS